MKSQQVLLYSTKTVKKVDFTDKIPFSFSFGGRGLFYIYVILVLENIFDLQPYEIDEFH